MALSYAQLQVKVSSFLQDAGLTIFDATELGHAEENEIKRLSDDRPALVDVIFQMESRYGTVSTTSTSNLTDTSKSQFVSGDATNEKVVHNTIDDTWATISSYTSSSVLALNKDIFVSGDTYEIYNKRCKNKKQIYIGDMPAYLHVDSVEYPIGHRRNFKRISEDVIEIDVNLVDDSNPTLSPLGRVDVLVRFAMPQVLCQLTDLSGELSAGASAGATSISIDGMGSTEIIEVGEMFTLENHRSTYVVSAQVTTSGNAATVSFYPPLEAASSDNDDITFVKSTLKPDEESWLIRLIAARVALSHSTKSYAQVDTAITTLANAATAISAVAALISLATTAGTGDIALARAATALGVTAISDGNTELAKIVTAVELAKTAIASGLSYANTIPVGGGLMDYLATANGDLGEAQGRLSNWTAYAQKASADFNNTSADLTISNSDLRAAAEKIQEGLSNLQIVASRMRVAEGGRNFENWGRTELAKVESELTASNSYRHSTRYPRD
jgi:hypothetical protein